VSQTDAQRHSETRRQLEVTARRILGETSSAAAGATDAAKKAGPAVAVAGAILAFLWGRHRGRRRRAYVTVRRTRR
jgi:uncharacterized membrane protein